MCRFLSFSYHFGISRNATCLQVQYIDVQVRAHLQKKNHIAFSPGNKDYPSPSRTPIHQPLDNIGSPNKYCRLGQKAVREKPTPPNSLAPEQTQSESRLSFATRLFCVEGSPGIKKNPSSPEQRRDRGAESLNRRTNKGKGGDLRLERWERFSALRQPGNRARRDFKKQTPPPHPPGFSDRPLTSAAKFNPVAKNF